jgi:hypothetical protein
MAFYIENRLGISAPPEVIWSILSDIEGWPTWASLYRKSSGVLRIGERISAEVAIPGEPVETVNYTLLDWAPDMQIHMRVSLYGGLFSTTRYMEIEKLTETGCIFGNGEIFRGPLARFMPRKLKAALRQAFAEMSEALKDRAEAAWREQGGTPT